MMYIMGCWKIWFWYEIGC